MDGQHCSHTISAAEESLRRLSADWQRFAVATLALWCARSRQRRALATLEGHMLRDLGIDRAAAIAEARKWFWQP